MHYAVPRILHAAGELDHFFTDICAGKGWLQLSRLIPAAWQPDGLRRVASRVPRGVPNDQITAFNGFGLRYALRRRKAHSAHDMLMAFLWAGQAFCRGVVRQGLGRASGVYVFNSAGLEILEAGRRESRRCVVEQTIAPQRLERQIQRLEQEKFPGWQDEQGEAATVRAYCEREETEWQLADLILCGSPFVRDGIAACGGPLERCVVVPYGIDGSFRMPSRRNHSGPLRVLTVGAVGLRKGAPYVLAAARTLREKAQFRMVGAIEVSATAAELLAESIELTGPIPRPEMQAQFAWADVFLLPSLCEGSATVIYEALASSLPVVCTANAGSVVRDGIEGMIVPICDGAAIVDALMRLADDQELRQSMAAAAARRAASFDLTSYGRRLTSALTGAEACKE
jgi:glycosyltransferase involved in cell wall biosynthesis